MRTSRTLLRRRGLLAAALLGLAPLLPAQSPPVRRAEPAEQAADLPVRRAELVEDDVTQPPSRSNVRKPETSRPQGAATSPEQNLFDYANLVYGQKAYDLAVKQYTEYLRLYPKGEHAQKAWYRLGESHLNLNRPTEAEQAYRQLIENFKRGDYVANAAYRIASLAYNRKNHGQAAAYFDVAIANTQQEKVRQSALYYRGRSLTEQGKPDLAHQAFEKLAETRENNPYWDRAVLQMARVHKAAGKTAEARRDYQRLASDAVDPATKAEALVELGSLLADAGEQAEAIKSFEQALLINTSDKDSPIHALRSLARYGLIELYTKTGEWQKVVDSYQFTEVTQIPENLRPRTWLRVGEAYRHLNNCRRAIDLFMMIDQYFPRSPENAEAGFRRLLCLNELKDPSLPQVAEEVIARIRSHDPESDQIDLSRFLIAENYFLRGEHALACEAYKKLRVEKIPEKFHGPLHFHMGWACAEAGRPGEAVTAFTKFIEAHPQDPQIPAVLAKRGLAYKAMEDWKNAEADFGRIIEQHADSTAAELAHEQLALIKGQRRDVEGMVAAFEKLLEKYPVSRAAPAAYYWIGSGRFDLKQYEQAVTALEKARQLDPQTYGREAGLKILLSYYYLQDLERLVKAVEAERLKEGGEARVPRPVYQYIGLKYFEREDMTLADKYLTLAATTAAPHETDPRVWYALSEARLATDRHEAAIEAADHYVSREDLAPALKAKGLLNKATALFYLRRFDEAAPLANEALRLQPEARVQAYLRLLLGDISAARGDYQNAAQIYVIPSQMFDDPEITPLALWKTVQALTRAGKEKEAADYRQDLEKRFPAFQPPRQRPLEPEQARSEPEQA